MKTKTKIIILSFLGLSLAIYGGFLIKKAFIDKGFPNENIEKEVLLGNYVILIGLPNTKENRDKYRSLTIEQLKKELGFNDNIIE
jgi:hypothetical protein